MGRAQPVLFHCQVFIDISFELPLYTCPSPAPRESQIINTIWESPESLHCPQVWGRAGFGWGAVGSSRQGFRGSSFRAYSF